MTTAQDALFDPLTLGAIPLSNRVLMAPLTRNRSHADGTPADMAIEYYRQRAGAGVIFTEATQISAMGKGYIDTPGIYTDKHIAAWRKIIDAVHAAGGRIICQLWHVGRISHTSVLPEGRSPVSSTDTAAKAQTFVDGGMQDTSKPEALTKEGIAATIADYAHAARCAKEAGFDGVEVHAANGYLIDQFLQDSVNDRTDAYGGSIANRMRFLEEALDAVETVWDRDRIGVRLSPLGQANDMGDSDVPAHFGAIYKMLSNRNLAFLHVVEAFPGNDQDEGRAIIDGLRQHYVGHYIANGDYTADTARAAIAAGHAAAVTFGRPFIANPDLPERFRIGADLNEPNPDTFYGGDETGYTDYPFLSDKAA